MAKWPYIISFCSKLKNNHMMLLCDANLNFSDPFARVAFLNQSLVTEKLDKTLCPTWDQTLIFEQIDIHGSPEKIQEKPPEIVVEIFDHDTFVRICFYLL